MQKVCVLAAVLLLVPLRGFSCGEEDLSFTKVEVFMDLYFVGVDYKQSLKKTRNDAFTKIVSSDPDYIHEFYDYLCDYDYKPTSSDMNDQANYLVIDFFHSDPQAKKISFSSDGNYLYNSKGYKAVVDKSFRLRFHFSDDDLAVRILQ